MHTSSRQGNSCASLLVQATAFSQATICKAKAVVTLAFWTYFQSPLHPTATRKLPNIDMHAPMRGVPGSTRWRSHRGALLAVVNHSPHHRRHHAAVQPSGLIPVLMKTHRLQPQACQCKLLWCYVRPPPPAVASAAPLRPLVPECQAALRKTCLLIAPCRPPRPAQLQAMGQLQQRGPSCGSAPAHTTTHCRLQAMLCTQH